MNNNKVVLVTGASRGIGAAAAIRFARAGFDVVLNYRASAQQATNVAEQIKQAGQQCLLIQADVSDEQSVIAMFKKIQDSFGRLDVLVNNAAVLMPQMSLMDMDAARINRVLQTNVTGAFLCCREAVRLMTTGSESRGGAIVNVSSVAAKTGSPFEYVDYAASKGALDTLTIGLAKEVGAKGIRVNGVRPGLIYTDMHADGGDPNRVDKLKDRTLLKRGGHAEEVAEAIFWLASEQSSFTTGSFIDVAGGLG